MQLGGVELRLDEVGDLAQSGHDAAWRTHDDLGLDPLLGEPELDGKGLRLLVRGDARSLQHLGVVDDAPGAGHQRVVDGVDEHQLGADGLGRVGAEAHGPESVVAPVDAHHDQGKLAFIHCDAPHSWFPKLPGPRGPRPRSRRRPCGRPRPS